MEHRIYNASRAEGRMDLTCSKYDKMHRAIAVMKSRVAEAVEVSVRCSGLLVHQSSRRTNFMIV